MKKVIALLLTLSLMLVAVACGGTGRNDAQNNAQNGVENNVQDDAQDNAQNDIQNDTQNDTQDDAQDGEDQSDGQEDADQPEDDTGDQEAGDQENGDSQDSPVLSHTDVTLKAAGNTFTLQVKGMSGAYSVIYTSADSAIAAVDEKGVVTAVAPGTTTVSARVERDGRTYELSCTVRCNWKTDSGNSGSGSGDDSGSAASVDLTAFYNDMTSQYEFGSLQSFTGDVLESYYPGMGAVSTKQCLVMGTMMTMNNGEFCLVEVSDSKDVDTVKSIFQSRIDYMVNGGAWYPGPTDMWTNNSRVVSNGNFVMMVVHESCDDIVTAFNGLFA